MVENVLHIGRFRRQFDVARFRLPMHGHFAGLALAFHHQQFIAGIRRAGQAQHHHRNGGPG
jgi:hypothetical protein